MNKKEAKQIEMNKYEYNCFLIKRNTAGGAIELLNVLGLDGWHVYHHQDHEEGFLAFAARKINPIEKE